MKLVIAAFALGTALVACKSNEKSSPEPASKQAPPQDPAPAPPAAPTASQLPTAEIDELAKAVLAALGDKEPAALRALAFKGGDALPMFEALKAACPDKAPKGDLATAANQMADMIGSDADRDKTIDQIREACAEVADFTKATFVKAAAKDATLECGVGKADNVIIEATVDGKPVFVHVDDPMKTGTGWKFPEQIRCAADRAAL